MDPDYILVAGGDTAGSAQRRSMAIKQWLEMKGDAEYVRAIEAIERTTEREAWRAFRHQNGRSVVRSFRVCRGEAICDSPLGLDINRWMLAQGQDIGHTLLSSLATLDMDHVVTSIQGAGRFCGPRTGQRGHATTPSPGTVSATSVFNRTGTASW